MKLKFFLINFCFLLFLATTFSQVPSDDVFQKYAKESFPQLKELLAMPNDANIPDDLEDNIKWSEKHILSKWSKKCGSIAIALIICRN